MQPGEGSEAVHAAAAAVSSSSESQVTSFFSNPSQQQLQQQILPPLPAVGSSSSSSTFSEVDETALPFEDRTMSQLLSRDTFLRLSRKESITALPSLSSTPSSSSSSSSSSFVPLSPAASVSSRLVQQQQQMHDILLIAEQMQGAAAAAAAAASVPSPEEIMDINLVSSREQHAFAVVAADTADVEHRQYIMRPRRARIQLILWLNSIRQLMNIHQLKIAAPRLMMTPQLLLIYLVIVIILLILDNVRLHHSVEPFRSFSFVLPLCPCACLSSSSSFFLCIYTVFVLICCSRHWNDNCRAVLDG